MTTDNSKDQAERETIKQALEKVTKLPADALARGGRNLAEEAARFLQDAHEAAARRDK
jgi:hypothetical protein